MADVLALRNGTIYQALRHLAIHAQENAPKFDNRGPLPDACYKFVHGPNSDPGAVSAADREWCAEFACYMAYLGGTLHGPKTASTGGLADWGKKCGGFKPHASGAVEFGDIGLVIDPSSITGYCHTVIIIGGDGHNLRTVEGNFQNGVHTNHRCMDTMNYIEPYMMEV